MRAWLPVRLPVMMLLLCAQITDHGADIKPLPWHGTGTPTRDYGLLCEGDVYFWGNHESLLHGKWTQICFRCPTRFFFVFFITVFRLIGCKNCVTRLYYEWTFPFAPVYHLPWAAWEPRCISQPTAACSLMCDAQFYRFGFAICQAETPLWITTV